MEAINITNAAQRASFISEGNLRLRPAQAGWIARELGYEHNRKVTPLHVAKLAEYMRRGQWLDKSALDFARLPDGRLILVNGHHRMAAQAQTAVDVTWNVIIHDVRNENDVRALYYRFDTEVRKRSAANIVGGVGLAEDCGIRKETATALWNASQIIANDMRFRRYDQVEKIDVLVDERLTVCRNFASQAKVMERFISTAPAFIRPKLKTVSIFSIALVTLLHQPVGAEAFWSGLCEDNGLRKGDPRKTLLMDMQVRGTTGSLVAAHLMAAAKAWNAFYEDRPLKIIKITGHPVEILGTPYTVSA